MGNRELAIALLEQATELLNESIFKKYTYYFVQSSLKRNHQIDTNKSIDVYDSIEDAICASVHNENKIDKNKNEIIMKKQILNIFCSLYKCEINKLENGKANLRKAKITKIKEFNSIEDMFKYINFSIKYDEIDKNLYNKLYNEFKDMISKIKSVDKPMGVKFVSLNKEDINAFLENDYEDITIIELDFHKTTSLEIINSMDEHTYAKKLSDWQNDILKYIKKLNAIISKKYKIKDDWDKHEGYIYITR